MENTEPVHANDPTYENFMWFGSSDPDGCDDGPGTYEGGETGDPVSCESFSGTGFTFLRSKNTDPATDPDAEEVGAWLVPEPDSPR